jgi:RHH-type rel operon transcriptional repressor/antitoxin RelB
MATVRFAADIEQRLERLARKTGRTKTFYITKAVVDHLDDMEDYYGAQEVLERVRRGEERILSAEEVRRNLGLDS